MDWQVAWLFEMHKHHFYSGLLHVASSCKDPSLNINMEKFNGNRLVSQNIEIEIKFVLALGTQRTSCKANEEEW